MLHSPSELHPCLTNERIDHIGQMISRVRAENLDSADPRDTGWSLGCRAYTWVCSEIAMASETLEWLKVVDPSLRFVASIDDVQFSVYKGVVEKPNGNICSRAQTYPELRQKTLLFDTPIPERLAWAYAVETDMEGMVTNIEFVGMSEAGEVVASRRVPLHEDSVTVTGLSVYAAEPADLPAAPVSLPKTKSDKRNEVGESE